MLPNAQSSDRRRFGRRDTSIEASVSVRGRPALTCVLRNYSETGALLEFREPAPTAHMFRLNIGSKSIDLLCQVRHRAPKTLGVAFVGGMVAEFVEVFRPQPLIPVARAVEKAHAEPVEQPSEIIETTATDGTVPSSESAASEGVVQPNKVTSLTIEQTGSPAHSMIESLYDKLQAIPELVAAGFRLEDLEDEAVLVLCQRMIRRGTWHQEADRLIWTPTGLGFEPDEVMSVDEATLRTMSIVLALLQRRQRSLRSIGQDIQMQDAPTPSA